MAIEASLRATRLERNAWLARTPWGRLEDWVSIVCLAAMTLLPVSEMVGRWVIGRGAIPGSIPMVQHLTLWVAMLGAALAARSDRLLALSTLKALPERWRPGLRVAASAMGVGVVVILGVASLDLVRIERGADSVFGWEVPLWVALLVMPVAFFAIAARLLWLASDTLRGRLLAGLGLVVPLLVWLVPEDRWPHLVGVGVVAIVVALFLGMPIFAAIGGLGALLFLADGTPINAIPGETYNLATNSVLPAIPLFALGGYILAEGGSSRRLTRLFAALVGWMPGGLAIVTTLVLAFFTPLTGASGITIVSMGGLLLPVMVKARYPELTSIGLVTVSGSIGLLFFPSLPVILYGFYANQPIDRLFIGGFVPGLLLVLAVAGWGAVQGVRHGADRQPFVLSEAGQAVNQAKWELLVPVVVLGAFFGGLATLVEAAALSVVYAFVIEVIVHRDLHPSKDLPAVVIQCATLVGAFLIILGVALGFTNYLVLTEVPMQAVDWVQDHIESKIVFLLVLNVLLIAVGALMDIYSAIIIVVPLIHPMALAYGIDPVHLGILFLTNMELGYLMPPMGENLFLAAFRFEQPLSRIYRSTLPFVLLLLVVVLLVTYVPELTLGPVRLLGR